MVEENPLISSPAMPTTTWPGTVLAMSSARAEEILQARGIELRHEVIGHLDDKLVTGDEGYDSRFHPLEVAVRVGPQLLDAGGVHRLGDVVHPSVLDCESVRAADTRRAKLVAEPGPLALGLLQLRPERFNALRQLLRSSIERLRELREKLAVPAHELIRRLADDHVDPAQP